MLRHALLALSLMTSGLGFAACSDDDYGQDRPAQDISAEAEDGGEADLAKLPDLVTPPDLADGGASTDLAVED